MNRRSFLKTCFGGVVGAVAAVVIPAPKATLEGHPVTIQPIEYPVD